MASRLLKSKGRFAAFVVKEPLVHFFLAGALLFAVEEWRGGDEARTIVVTPGVRQDLRRRFADARGRPPTDEELGLELEAWEREEALFREAIRRGLDQDDANVRSALVSKMVSIAESEVGRFEPTDAEIAKWYAENQARYETPRRFDFEYLEFESFSDPPGDAVSGDAAPSGDAAIDSAEAALRGGADPRQLGRPVHGGHLTREVMAQRLPELLAMQIPKLEPGKWVRLASGSARFLVRLKRVSGGIPEPQEILPMLVSDWKLAQRKTAVDAIIDETVALYEIEER